MHILLSDCITLAQVDAAEQMLVDFCILLPELYGERSCTANAHLLTHLAHYVRLWGPLWTHSAFAFESKSGHLKHLFHGKSNIIHQLLFNVDVTYTLQTVHEHLTECESEETLQYLCQSVHRRNMTWIVGHTYMVGQYKSTTPTTEQSNSLHYNGRIQIFFRLFKDGVTFHSTSYPRAHQGKRNNTYCCFRQGPDSSTRFGQIELFTTTPTPCALLREMYPSDTSLLNQAGHPCRTSLSHYVEADLLSSYIVPINNRSPNTSTSPLLAVPLIYIMSKLVVISVSDQHYCILQPNHMERH